MQKVLDHLSANSTVFLATSDNGAPRVRPFQYQFEDKGRLWFCTSKKKEVFEQLKNDQRVELSCTAPNMTTLRLRGMAVLEDSAEIKKRIFEQNDMVRSIYGTADNPEFTVFSIDHGKAQMFDFNDNPPQVFSF